MNDLSIRNMGDPNVPEDERVTYFGVTDSRNKMAPFGIKREDRSRHTYVIGKTGMGKSTLLENMAAQDIINGEGLCFIDPHGGSAEMMLNYISEERVKDVLYFAPFDMEYPISFNVLEDVDPDKRHLVVAGLMSTFEKIWVDAWSSRMAYILQNTLAALLEFPGATLLSVNRMYIDKEYRKNVISKITDSSVRSFWVDEYSKYTDRYAQEATPAIQNKIGQFASNALVRNVIGQPHSSFDIRKLMDEKKIFLVNLSKGRIGEGNANLLGNMLITKIYLAAMSRADAAPKEMSTLPPFYLFVDEFQNFANRSFADILSEARKYKLALTIAHQYVEQMDEEVRAAVFGNVGTMMTFRVGAYDAELLEKEFAPVFTADDLVNLGARQIYLKLMIDGVSSSPFSARTLPPVEEPEISHRDRAMAYSRSQYAQPRGEIEKAIADWVDKVYQDPDKDAKDAARAQRRAERDAEGGGSTNRGPKRPNNQRGRSPGGNNDEHKKDLRNLLKQMTHDTKPAEKKPAAKPVTPAVAVKTVKTEKKAPQKEVKNVPKKTTPPVQKKDDGKGITDEGKSELRNLLSSLTKDVPKKQQKAPEKKPVQVQEKAEAPKQQQSPEVKVEDKKETKSQSERKIPREVPKEKMEKMLHVDKPNI